MKNEITKILERNQGKIPLAALGGLLKASDLKVLDQTLKSMAQTQEICLTKAENVYLLSSKGYHCGLLKIHPKGFGFVSDFRDLEHENYFVPPVAMKGAIKDDEVIYRVVEDHDGRQKAEIVEIAVRTKEFLIGEIKKSPDGRFFDFIPNDVAFSNFHTVMINAKDFLITENSLYKAKILEAKDRKLFLRLKKRIGDSTKAADRILAIAEEFDLPSSFGAATLRNAELVNVQARQQKAEFSKRLTHSLIGKNLVTIDGPDSKDLDDAIYVEKNAQGFKLIVAIADVSYYVQANSPLDQEALHRGNSTYLANAVIPMLPKILSDDLCSLNPYTEKFVMACEMQFDFQGQMIKREIFESVMVSQARLTYDECNHYFKNKIWTKDSQIAQMLDDAYELYKKLFTIREQKGMLNLEIREPKIIMDSQSHVVAIKARQSGPAEQLIEQFMVSANEAVAELVWARKLPFIYRNHKQPSPEALTEWYQNLKLFGIDLHLTNKEMLNPLNLNKALKSIAQQSPNEIEKELLNLSLLRHLDKAEYGLENIGHFGLASPCYTHFTSPIRRYPDLMVHRFLREYFLNGQLTPSLLTTNQEFIQKATIIVNETEINSVDCEREVVKACMVEFMSDKVGQIYEGVIAAVLKFGFFVQLENLVEGLVHISTLGDEIKYDEKTQTLIGHNNLFYRLGQVVKIKVMAVDNQKRTIDFAMV